MGDRTAASGGFVLAGVALAAGVYGLRPGDVPLAGGGVALAVVAAAGVALLGFALRRYGRVGPRVGAPLAATGAVGAAAVATYWALQGGPPVVAAAAAMAGLGGAVAAYADWLGLDGGALAVRTDSTLKAVMIGALGILAIYAWGFVALVSAQVLSGGVPGRPVVTVLSTLASGAGTVTVVVLYLRWTDADASYLDVRWPTLRGVGYALGGALAILGGNLVIGLAFQRVGLRTAQHAVIRTAEAEPAVLLALIPLSLLVIGPGEELLYRNVVQKSLRETFSPAAGVVVASLVFAVVHLPAYFDSSSGLLATANTLTVIFVLALVLGALYERTGNVVVPALAHGSFNAIAFAATYAQLTGLLGA